MLFLVDAIQFLNFLKKLFLRIFSSPVLSWTYNNETLNLITETALVETTKFNSYLTH